MSEGSLLHLSSQFINLGLAVCSNAIQLGELPLDISRTPVGSLYLRLQSHQPAFISSSRAAFYWSTCFANAVHLWLQQFADARDY